MSKEVTAAIRPTTTPTGDYKPLYNSDCSPYLTTKSGGGGIMTPNEASARRRRNKDGKTPTVGDITKDMQNVRDIYEMLKAEVKVNPNIAIND